MLDDLQLDQITDPHAQEVIWRVLNLVETLSTGATPAASANSAAALSSAPGNDAGALRRERLDVARARSIARVA